MKAAFDSVITTNMTGPHWSCLHHYVPALTLAHELGHVLAMDRSPDDSGCFVEAGHCIMSGRFVWTVPFWTLNERDLIKRRILLKDHMLFQVNGVSNGLPLRQPQSASTAIRVILWCLLVASIILAGVVLYFYLQWRRSDEIHLQLLQEEEEEQEDVAADGNDDPEAAMAAGARRRKRGKGRRKGSSKRHVLLALLVLCRSSRLAREQLSSYCVSLEHGCLFLLLLCESLQRVCPNYKLQRLLLVPCNAKGCGRDLVSKGERVQSRCCFVARACSRLYSHLESPLLSILFHLFHPLQTSWQKAVHLRQAE